MSVSVPVPMLSPPVQPLSPEQWPNLDNLVTDDGVPVDGRYSERQMRLLTEPLYSSWPGPGAGRSFLVMANVGLFYHVRLPPVVPDTLLSLDVSVPEDLKQKRSRSYFLWEYGKPPEVAIEVVSNLEGDENGRKKGIYEQIGVTYYVIWDPDDLLKIGRLVGYALRERTYEPLTDLWFPRVGLGLTPWHGSFERVEADWLRWREGDGRIVPTGAERAERLSAQLRGLAVEPAK